MRCKLNVTRYPNVGLRWVLGVLLGTLTGVAAAGPSPCSDPGHRQFDFWEGSWRVETAEGQHAGDNRIVRAERGCLMVENWQGSRGATGTSLNFYSRELDGWRQVWVSPGVIIDIAGGLVDGSMVLTGTITYQAQAASRPFRGTWTPLPDGRVRQFFEEQRPDEAGEIGWQPWFEGFYARQADDAEGPDVDG